MTKKSQKSKSQQSVASPTNGKNKDDASEKVRTIEARAKIVVAIITLVVALIGLINALPWKEWFPANPTSTATATSTITETLLPLVLPSQTSFPTPVLINTAISTAAPTQISTATASPSPEPKTDRMDAILVANLLEGKAPLVVNFDARASSIQFADGSVSECGNSQFCSFIFTIIPDGRPADTFNQLEGRLSYKFGRKGEYIVAVYVCRGGACDEDSVEISVR